MSPELIIALVQVGAQVVIEGGKVIASFRQEMTSQQLIDALLKTKSQTWPDYTFESPNK